MHLAAMIGYLQLVAPAAFAWFASAAQMFARTAGPTLVTSIWQGAVIACGLEICLRVMPRISAAHRFALWWAGFGVAAGLPLFGLAHWGAGEAANGVANSEMTGSSVGPLLQLDVRWGLAIAALWLAASLIRVSILAMHSVRLHRLWKTARPVEGSSRLTAGLQDVRGGRVRICTTEMLDRPSVIGFLAPRILIPAWLMARLTSGELEQIVLHEAEHLRRNDDWTNLIQKLALVAFPLNPALAWIEHRLGREREMACDEGVVRITNAPRAYAACLASLAERGMERQSEALTLGAWHRRSELVHRVHRILLQRRGLNKAAAGALLGALGCALMAGSVEMARAPQLVTFVAKQNHLAMTPARQQEMAKILAREDADAKISLPAGFRAARSRAVMPEGVHASTANASKHYEKNSAADAVKMAVKKDPRKPAEVDSDLARADSGVEQQWIVTAAWEEIRTVSRTSTTITDYYASSASEAAGNDAMQTQQNDRKVLGHATNRLPSQTSRYAITQLILRMAPANSSTDSTQPVMVRDGWFVIQL
jgi:beta-lactamase regulating signal transducer with metallopeptidase domain